MIFCFFLAPFSLCHAQAPTRAPHIHEYIYVNREPSPINLKEVRAQIGYPIAAVKQNIEGVIHCRILVDEEGKYERHTFTRNAHPILMKAVDRQLETLRFRPAIKERVPIKYWVNVPFSFRLKHDAQQAISQQVKQTRHWGKRNPTKAQAHFEAGLMFLENQQYEQALDMLTKSLRFNPHAKRRRQKWWLMSFYTHLLRAEALTAEGKWTTALEDYTEAIGLGKQYTQEVAPYLVQAHIGRAHLHYLSGDIQRAINDYNWMLRMYEVAPAWHQPELLELRLGLMAYQEELLLEQEYQRSTSAPQAPLAIFLHAMKQARIGHTELAIKLHRRVIQRTDSLPLKVHAWARIGELLRQQGNHQQAFTAWQRAMDLDPTHPLPYFYKGAQIHQLEGQEAAREALSAALVRGLDGHHRLEALALLQQLQASN